MECEVEDLGFSSGKKCTKRATNWWFHCPVCPKHADMFRTRRPQWMVAQTLEPIDEPSEETQRIRSYREATEEARKIHKELAEKTRGMEDMPDNVKLK